jgi:hypothetical protein
MYCNRSRVISLTALAQDFVRASDVERHIGETFSVDNSSNLSAAIAAAQAQVETYIGYPLQEAEVEETFDNPSPTARLLLTRFPNAVVSSVENENGVAQDYLLDRGGVLKPLKRFSGKTIVVTYTGGYTSLPADLAQACVEIAKEIYLRRSRSASVSNEQAENVAVAFDTSLFGAGLSPAARILLDGYRRLEV